MEWKTYQVKLKNNNKTLFIYYSKEHIGNITAIREAIENFTRVNIGYSIDGELIIECKEVKY